MLEEFQRDHGLFIAFAPVENPQIAVGVIVENNASEAVRVARKVLDAYLLPRLENDDSASRAGAASEPESQ